MTFHWSLVHQLPLASSLGRCTDQTRHCRVPQPQLMMLGKEVQATHQCEERLNHPEWGHRMTPTASRRRPVGLGPAESSSEEVAVVLVV